MNLWVWKCPQSILNNPFNSAYFTLSLNLQVRNSIGGMQMAAVYRGCGKSSEYGCTCMRKTSVAENMIHAVSMLSLLSVWPVSKASSLSATLSLISCKVDMYINTTALGSSENWRYLEGSGIRSHLKGGGGKVQAQNFWKISYELWVGSHGQDMYQQLEGGFGPMNPILPMWGLGTWSTRTA